MVKKSKEEIIDMKLKDYYDNLCHFMNALTEAGIYWQDISQKIYVHNLLLQNSKVYDKKKNETITEIMIPNRMDFLNALSACGVRRELFHHEVTISFVDSNDILNRAKIIAKYNKIYPPNSTDKNALSPVIVYHDDSVMELDMMCGYNPENYDKYL